MSGWIKILLFVPIWLMFSAIFYSIVYLIYPNSFSLSKNEFDTLMANDFGFLLISQLAVFFGTFSAILFISKFIDKKKPTFLKSMLSLNGMLLGIVLGAIEIILIIIILSITIKIRITFQSLSTNILWYIIIFFIVAISEETLSRGYIFTNLYNQTNKYLAIFISSLIFSLMHFFNSSMNWIGILNIVLVGIFFCQLYLIRMDLSIPIGFHFSWNLFQGPVFGFSVSGFTTQSILNIEDFSGTKFSFENFGLEGSLISTCVLVVSILFYFIYYSKYWSGSKRVLSSQNLVIE